jgi:hypothetical protein
MAMAGAVIASAAPEEDRTAAVEAAAVKT